jgi:SAM-dependent methyltransferase
MILDVLEAERGRRFSVLDLGSGPGSLSARILRRFPRARVVAVDYDPVVRRIGEGALAHFGRRLVWVDAKLGRPGWTDALPGRRYDVAVSTTALHWLGPAQLTRLYNDLGRVLGKGGVFLNGDWLPWGPRDGDLRKLAGRLPNIRLPVRGRGGRWGAWRKWWDDARKVPALRAAFEEHDRRSASHPDRRHTTLDQHVRRLRDAGFRTVATVWQVGEDRILFARR